MWSLDRKDFYYFLFFIYFVSSFSFFVCKDSDFYYFFEFVTLNENEMIFYVCCLMGPGILLFCQVNYQTSFFFKKKISWGLGWG